MPPRRRAAAPVGAVLGILAVGVAAVASVVWYLDSRDPAATREWCAATLDGRDHPLSPVQAGNAALIVGQTVQRGLPARAATIGLATAMQESRLVNIDYGDRDSIGLFQQRPSQGWGTVEEIMDPVYSTDAFYDGLVEVDGWQDMEVTDAAQEVQRSAFPEAYAQHEQMARAWASSLTGHSPGSVTCELPGVGADGPSGASAVTTLTDLLERDLGVPTGSVDEVDDPQGDGRVALAIDATALPVDEVERATWTVAHWAVATADTTGAVEVRAADQVWSRGTGAWTLVDEGEPQPEGRVTVVVGPQPASLY
ncbi:hypothetical protein ACNHYB_06560 [Isoptericola jiangsuensis]|uniref:hypothetical protein n=1 Tax=Isoptericola jiangsuensis TaxID=548579 RepID=UPI003AAA99AF